MRPINRWLAPRERGSSDPGHGTRVPGPGSRAPGPGPPGLAWFMIKLDSMCMFTDKKTRNAIGKQRRKPLPRRLLRRAHPQRSAPRAARGWQTQAAASGMTNSTSLARLPTPAALARRTATDSCPLRRILLRRKALSRHLEASEPRCHGGRGRVSPRSCIRSGLRP